MISVEKPGSPSEILEHAGVKGMKWGVRKAVETVGTTATSMKPFSSSKPKKSLTPAQTAAKVAQTEHRKKIAKRIAIGVAVTSVVAGSAFVAYKMRQNHLMKASQIQRAVNIESQADSIADILSAVSGGNVERIR